jgi:hypothetical protein
MQHPCAWVLPFQVFSWSSVWPSARICMFVRSENFWKTIESSTPTFWRDRLNKAIRPAAGRWCSATCIFQRLISSTIGQRFSRNNREYRTIHTSHMNVWSCKDLSGVVLTFQLFRSSTPCIRCPCKMSKWRKTTTFGAYLTTCYHFCAKRHLTTTFEAGLRRRALIRDLNRFLTVWAHLSGLRGNNKHKKVWTRNFKN